MHGNINKASWLDKFLCRAFGHPKKTYECALGGHHCHRCHTYLSISTANAVAEALRGEHWGHS